MPPPYDVNNFLNLLGIEIVGEGERTTARLTVHHDLIAGTGYLWAPVVIGIADALCAFGVSRHWPDNAMSFTTVEAKANFISSAKEGEVVVGAATPLHLGSTTQVWDGAVRNETTGKTMAAYRCTQLILYPRAWRGGARDPRLPGEDLGTALSIGGIAVRVGGGTSDAPARKEIQMTQYLLSVHSVEGREMPSEEQMQQAFKQVDAFNAELRATGNWVFAGGLHPPSTATVVRSQGGEVLTTDGPFAEAKEQIGGFWVITAPDLDAALALAAKASEACMEAVEVRPFQDAPEE